MIFNTAGIMKFLITNDDGIDSPGLMALADVFAKKGEVLVIAPAAERSGYGHAFSYKRPIYYTERKLVGGHRGIAVEGTPVDCVKMGLFWTDTPFDWVLSGINLGANVGIDCFYSGTIGGASEGAIQGVPSIAFSMQTLHDPTVESPMNVHSAALLCGKMFDQVAARPTPPPHCLNVNIPALPLSHIKGVFASSQAHQRYLPTFASEPAGDGRSVLFRPKVNILPDESKNVDYARLMGGWITITPLLIDRTDHTALEELQGWNWTF